MLLSDVCGAVQAYDSLELTEEKINAITDQIPQKPVTLVEGTSYLAIIAAAFTVRHIQLSQQSTCNLSSTCLQQAKPALSGKGCFHDVG
jgi:hypothetical protein